jgi:hypothetical protein
MFVQGCRGCGAYFQLPHPYYRLYFFFKKKKKEEIPRQPLQPRHIRSKSLIHNNGIKNDSQQPISHIMKQGLSSSLHYYRHIERTT